MQCSICATSSSETIERRMLGVHIGEIIMVQSCYFEKTANNLEHYVIVIEYDLVNNSPSSKTVTHQRKRKLIQVYYYYYQDSTIEWYTLSRQSVYCTPNFSNSLVLQNNRSISDGYSPCLYKRHLLGTDELFATPLESLTM